ncbi:hypothetical protein [Acetobacterium woodii]|nr:hypothetical protein [Acetobacterium woodii]
MNEGYALFIKEQNEDLKTDRIREDIKLSLTDKQYSNLKLKAYQAGFENAGDFIQSFVSDLTGWCSNGSDERDLAGQWYERAHGMSKFHCYFRYYLFNHDFHFGEMLEMIEDQDYFDEIYEEYKADAWGLEAQSKTDCIELLKKLVDPETEIEL